MRQMFMVMGSIGLLWLCVAVSSSAQVTTINFVTVLELASTGEFCVADLHPIEANQQSDAKEEVAAGMDFAATDDRVFFRGIIREDKAGQRGLVVCNLGPGGGQP